MKRVLIIGGYGNFGSYIARALAADPNIQLLIAGRSAVRAVEFATSLAGTNQPLAYVLDLNSETLADNILAASPDIVIHTTGPFQGQDHRVARAAIAAGAHYLDLADARKFVADIGQLDEAAKEARVAVISGASSVPCLTAAFIDRYRERFSRLESAVYGIAAAQATNRGLGTAAAILSYVGKPFTILAAGKSRRIFGWQGLEATRYPELGLRLFGHCDVPDLELFPTRYPDLEDLRFVAGHEVKLLHIGTWLLSWMVRLGMIRSLAPHSRRLLKLSFLFDRLGSDKSGFHMFLDGADHHGRPSSLRIFMIARQVHGPNIPCIPAIILARRFAAGVALPTGARPCLDMIELDEIMAEIAHLDITTLVVGNGFAEGWPGTRWLP